MRAYLWAILAGAALLAWLGRRFLPRTVRLWGGLLLIAVAAALFLFSQFLSKVPRWMLANQPVTLAAGESYSLLLQPNRAGEYHLEIDYAAKYFDIDAKYPDQSLDLKWTLAAENGAELKSGRETPVACAWSESHTTLCLPGARFDLESDRTYRLTVKVMMPCARETATKRLKVTADNEVMKAALVMGVLATLTALPLLLAGLILLPYRRRV